MKLFSAATFGGMMAITSLAFVACMGTNQESTEHADAKKMGADLPQGGLGYLVGLTKKAVTEVQSAENPGMNGDDGLAAAKAALQSAGVCQGLINVIDELSRFSTDFQNNGDLTGALNFSGYPNLQRMLTCTVPWINDSFDNTSDNMNLAPSTSDIMALSDCICGGSGSIFGIYAGQINTTWQGFSPVQSTGSGFSPVTSGSGFNATAAQTIGAGFSPSVSPMGEGFSPSSP